MKLLCTLLVAVTLAAADNNSNHNRIVGGYETTIKEHPYQVSIQFRQNHLCGGSILNEKFILTAAHCVARKNDFSDFSVRVGSSYIKQNGTEYKVEKAFVYPNFTLATMDCDVGLLSMKTPIVFGETVRPIQLVPENEIPQHGEILTISGWGLTKLDIFGKTPSSVLRAIQLPAVKIDLCRKAFTLSKMKITDNMICAGGAEGKFIYKGDSGGALVNAKKQIVGIASWGRGLQPTGYPSVYTNIASPQVRKFIFSVLNGTLT